MFQVNCTEKTYDDVKHKTYVKEWDVILGAGYHLYANKLILFIYFFFGDTWWWHL